MHRLFKEKEKEVMDRLAKLKNNIKLYKVAYEHCIKNYKTALSSYEVKDEEVDEYQRNEYNKPCKIQRRRGAKELKYNAVGAIFRPEKLDHFSI